MEEVKMTRYSGMCVGGPHDGAYIVNNQTPFFRVAIYKPFHAYYDPSTAVAETKTYKHYPALRGEFEIDLWLYEGITLNEAFEKIFMRYAQSSRESRDKDSR